MTPGRFLFACTLVGALGIGVGSCTTPPEAGEFGKFRFAGKVVGAPPVRLSPPTSDGSGNVYTLYGALDYRDVDVFVSKFGGGEISPCTFTKGDKYGAHGWVGFANDRSWYWAGNALVSVNGNGACDRVLDSDPGTDVSLAFTAVMPWVRDAPSRTSIVVMVQSALDATPFTAMIDLNVNLLSNIRAFEPSAATNVRTIGVGGSREKNVGVVLLEYDIDGKTVIEGRMYDPEASLTSSGVVVSNPLPEYGVQGFLQISDAGLVVGLLADGRMVAFDRSGGRILDTPSSMKPVGIHRWDGTLWLVGTQDNAPVIARIDDNGNPGAPIIWTASLDAAAALRGPQTIIDDRSLPSRTVTWPDVRTAVGDFPFLSPFPLTRYADGTTLWIVSGPQVDIGGTTQTSFAIAPVGVSYP